MGARGDVGVTGGAGLRTGALVCGALGGGIGVLVSLALVASATVSWLDGDDVVGGVNLLAGLLGVGAGVTGIVGGVMARSSTRTAAWLLGVAAVGGALATWIVWLVAGPVLLAGCVLAVLAGRRGAI